MNRSKLEYFIKNLMEYKKKEIIEEIDPNGDFKFDHLTIEFLKNPDTTDPFVLLAVPNYMDPTFVEAYKQKYVKQFELINDLCIKNNIYPFFKDPTNLVESELTREEICEQVHESILNEFFNVKSFREYQPPIYKPNNNENK